MSYHDTRTQGPLTVRIPADVERSDRLIGPFTARQLAILATTALLLYSVWIATRAVIAPLVFLAAAAPIAAVVTVAILTRRDGLSADLLLWAAIRHRWRSRHLVTASEGGRDRGGAEVDHRPGRTSPATPASSGGVIARGVTVAGLGRQQRRRCRGDRPRG
ncbi:PrgI family protein [Nocardia sp. NPDC049220]|uniref:PrgI family protein n=1 Tax=Nocardia sp. NPDC049220 TaxID=3155273 RepID=UPI00340713D1